MKIKPPKYRTWQLNVYADDRGALCPIELKEIDFVPKRIYFIFDVKKMRGAHAHMKEKEIFVCIKGKFTARVHDGKKLVKIKMDSPGKALYTSSMVWHEFENFSKDAVMLAITDTPYVGNKGYIMDFKEFLYKILNSKSETL